MPREPVKRLLAIAGSQRRASTNAALLRGLATGAPETIVIDLYAGLGALPIFNPDDEGERTPTSVVDLGARIRAADGLIIACPEYAHGIPGGLKNMLDWLVSRDEFPGKPIMLVRASTRSDIAHRALQEVLRTMSARLMPDIGLAIHLISRTPDEIAALCAEPERRAALRRALMDFSAFIDADG